MLFIIIINGHPLSQVSYFEIYMDKIRDLLDGEIKVSSS